MTQTTGHQLTQVLYVTNKLTFTWSLKGIENTINTKQQQQQQELTTNNEIHKLNISNSVSIRMMI